MTSKFLQQTIRQEDSNENVSRYEKQMEYAKQKKLEQIKERERRLAEMQRQKLEIAEEKRRLQEQLKERKEKMLKKVNEIIQSGNYKSKEEIYQKIFTEDELSELRRTSIYNSQYDSKYNTNMNTEEKSNSVKENSQRISGGMFITQDPRQGSGMVSERTNEEKENIKEDN